jgi:hypothetical protein
MPQFPSGLLPSDSSSHNSVYTSHLLNVCHTSNLPHSPQFALLNVTYNLIFLYSGYHFQWTWPTDMYDVQNSKTHVQFLFLKSFQSTFQSWNPCVTLYISYCILWWGILNALSKPPWQRYGKTGCGSIWKWMLLKQV